MKHRSALGGNQMKASAQQKGRIPAAVVDYLLTAPVKFRFANQSPKSPSNPPTPPVTSVVEPTQVPSRCLRDPYTYTLGKIAWEDDEAQLLLELDVILPNGDLRRVRALVDTGAQVNLIRKKLVPKHLLTSPSHPIRLVAANQEIIQGGDKMASLEMEFLVCGKVGGGVM